MAAEVVFTPEAEAALLEIYRYIADAASPNTAANYTDAIVGFCESLQTFPRVGTARDDVRAGLRVVTYKRRVVVAFTVEADRVLVLGVFYGGRDYASLLPHDEV